MKKIPIACLLLIAQLVHAQLDEIKAKSSEHTSSRSSKVSSSESSDNSGSSIGASIIGDVFEFAILGWQGAKLSKKDEVPGMVSLELMAQVAIQPSSYYLINPHIRGNWGLFSTDFRFSYLLEERIEGGVKHLRTDDWQILQLNILTTRTVGFRIGGGILHEGFGEGNTYGEGTFAIPFQTKNLEWGGVVEYRWSEPRTEWNAHVQKRIFDSGAWHGYATLGFAYQRYYESVDVWGVQLGIAIKVFK